MRGKWDLTKEELAKWQAVAKYQTQDIILHGSGIVDLTTEDITPYQVHQVLSSLGWENYDHDISVELDSWEYYRRKGNHDIVVYSNGMTFELVVYLKSDKNNIALKEAHRRNMIEV